MKVINPATEEIVQEVPEDSLLVIGDTYARLKGGQKKWKAVALEERIRCLEKFSDLLDLHKASLAEVLTSEMGKPLSQSVNEINGARSRIAFFTAHSGKWLSEEWMVEEGGTKELIRYEPLGVIANISAWNYPYLVGVNVFVPALIAGNAVLYKPSEYTTLTGLEIERLLIEAGVPSDVFKTVVGGKEAGQALLDLPLDGYFFTGSYQTGLAIARQVAPKLVPFQMELGGKDPLYVMDDVVDIAQVAAAVADGAFYNNGQSCCAVERIYVQEKIYEPFVNEFLAEVRRFRVGAPTEAGTYIGPIARREQMDVLRDQVKDAVEKGARLLTGGEPREGKGYYFKPTVLVDVDHTMRVMREESFGPIIGIQKVTDDEEAAVLMDDTEYGLTAAVYSQSRERAQQLIDRVNTGSVYWNCCDRVSPYLPWSGRKNSGLGATLSYAGIRAFVQPKSYHLRG
jgi:acyl-CoA reductase-like NAD-dependent aldehyde dehydrogenase